LDIVGTQEPLWQAMRTGMKHGLGVEPLDFLAPGGAVCYASRRNSIVIGADGQAYKCTVALDYEPNQVGRLGSDGVLAVDRDKLAQWIFSGEHDEACEQCCFHGACQGASCPLERMQDHQRPCPDVKVNLEYVLPMAVQR
jgi:uncharacterized protein